MSENRVIGKKNKLPWYLPRDLKRFKDLTFGKMVVMGRKTFESIGKTLNGRLNVIVTTKKDYKPLGCSMAYSIREALMIGEKIHYEEIFFIGGGEIFLQVLPLAQIIYLTLIHKNIEGDAFFPILNPDDWIEKERYGPMRDEKSGLEYSFLTLERKVKQ